MIDVWVEPKTAMPVRIDTLDGNRVTTRSTTLGDLAVNPPLKEASFKLDPIPEDKWNVHDEPFKE